MFRFLAVLALTLAASANAAMVGNMKPVDKTCVGSWAAMTSANAEDDCTKAIQAGVDELNSQSNSLYRMGAHHVVDGHKQVVSGLRYVFEVQVGPTECANDGSAQALGACVADEARLSTWELTVVSQPWKEPAYTVTSVQMKQ